jgi:hypothetical protein
VSTNSPWTSRASVCSAISRAAVRVIQVIALATAAKLVI